MTTLKEAYESAGETIQVGDVLCGFCEIEYVEGWNYALKGDSVLLYRADKIKHQVTDVISRNGKQIYPKVEKASAMQLKVDLLRYLEDNNTLMITETISDLIDAKIQEKMGDKCNS